MSNSLCVQESGWSFGNGKNKLTYIYFSLQTVSQLVGSAGSSLKPNLPTLIPSLLEAAGELESVKLSYLSAQYGGQAQSQEMIDVVRANIAKSHYTTQTLTKVCRVFFLFIVTSHFIF